MYTHFKTAPGTESLKIRYLTEINLFLNKPLFWHAICYVTL
jgi:hypothetical protein